MTALPGKRAVGPIDAGGIRLRLLEAGNLPTTLAWRNQDHTRRWFFTSQVIGSEQHRAWWERYRTLDDDFVFIIEDTVALNRPVGQVALYNIDWLAGRAEYGRLMIGDAAARGRGLARAATAALVEHGFHTLGLREIYLEVLASNVAAIQVYSATGFVESARHGDRVFMRRRHPAEPSIPQLPS